jgi:hypothetical protein
MNLKDENFIWPFLLGVAVGAMFFALTVAVTVAILART